MNNDVMNDKALSANEQFYLPDICTVQSLLFAVLAGTLLSVVFAIVSSKGLQTFDWLQFALIAFFVLWVVLLSVALLCQLRPYLTRLSLLQGVVISYAIVIAVTLIVSLLGQWVLTEFLGRRQAFDIWLTTEHVLVAAILAGVSLRYLYLQEQLHVQQQAELASRIQALQSRIRPHFLFNSMNIIASLIESDPQLAERVVEDLSELFRATLSDASQLVPVERELELAKSYVNIEALRLGDRLKVDWQVDAFNKNALLPHFSLQPLLENAIYHGIQPIAEGGTITVTLRQKSEKIFVNIVNPILSESQMADKKILDKKGNSLALDNFRHRLQAYYGEAAQLTTEKRGNKFEVSFSCPLTPIPQPRV